MTELAFGQPVGGVFQFAYTVEDIDAAMRDYTDRLGAGPWFLRGPFTPPEGRYRGEPMSASFSLARGFAGHAMIELIVQHDDMPSVFHPGEGQRRYGFHHWAVMTDALDAELARYHGLGYQEAFADRIPSGARIVYVDTTRDLPGMIELVEYTEAQERVYTDMYLAAVDWDGRDPVRRVDR